eukprot:2682148-Pyramimonas_sp.AAC.1
MSANGSTHLGSALADGHSLAWISTPATWRMRAPGAKDRCTLGADAQSCNQSDRVEDFTHYHDGSSRLHVAIAAH